MHKVFCWPPYAFPALLGPDSVPLCPQLPFDEIDSVEFARQGGGAVSSRTFDLVVRMKTDAEHQFRSINRTEWQSLFDFFQVGRSPTGAHYRVSRNSPPNLPCASRSNRVPCASLVPHGIKQAHSSARLSRLLHPPPPPSLPTYLVGQEAARGEP